MLDQVIVLNTTESKITDVRIFHEPTLRSAEVNAILPQRSLDIGFSGQPMLGKKGTVSWRDGAGVKREMTLELPHDHSAAREGRSMNLVYIIDSSGTVAAHLETPINSND
jgi:hypothetical protein